MLHYVSSDDMLPGGRTGCFTYRMHIPSNHDRIALLAASIPKSYYLIQPGQNYVMVDGGPYYIHVGNYSLTDLLYELNNVAAIALDTPGSPLLKTKLVWSVDYRSKKVSAHNIIGATTIPIVFPKQLARSLGFLHDVAYSAVGGLVSFDAIGPNVPNLCRSNQIWILCDICEDQSAQQIGSLLHNCYTNDTPDFSFIRYENSAPDYTAKTLKTYQKYTPVGTMNEVEAQFQFLDAIEQELDFNGVSLELVIRTWKDEPMYDLLWRYIQADMAIKNEVQLEKRQQQRKIQ